MVVTVNPKTTIITNARISDSIVRKRFGVETVRYGLSLTVPNNNWRSTIIADQRPEYVGFRGLRSGPTRWVKRS